MTERFANPAVDLTNKRILVTGGAGSFGRQFTRTVLSRFDNAYVVVFSRDEHKHYDFANDLTPEQNQRTRMFIGDVRDRERLRMAMRGVDVVVHAAALKHVPTAEYNPFECIHTNVFGAENIVNAAIENEVEHVIALSTDKAANPVNIYGASKLASDKIMVAGNSLAGGNRTRFAVVRYGNVVGSRGSVIPLFRRLVASGATELPITDAAMTRFWITLQQGVDFVLSTLAMMRGGEIFVPKIPSMRVVDLATAVAPDLPHKVIGIRPGEKLHELMISSDDARHTLELEDRYVIEPEFTFWRQGWESIPGGTPVAEGFSYSSDSNTEWLDVAGFRALLEQLE